MSMKENTMTLDAKTFDEETKRHYEASQRWHDQLVATLGELMPRGEQSFDQWMFDAFQAGLIKKIEMLRAVGVHRE